MASWDDLATQYPKLAPVFSTFRQGGASPDDVDATVNALIAARRQQYLKAGHAPNAAALNTLRDLGGISNEDIAAGRDATSNNSLTSAPFDLNARAKAVNAPVAAANIADVNQTIAQGALRQQGVAGRPGPRLDTSALIAKATAAKPDLKLREQLLSSEGANAKFNRVAQPVADKIMKAYVANRRKDLALRFDMSNPENRAYYNSYLVDGAMTAQNLLLGYAGDPNDLVDRGYITDKELQDYAQQTAGESKLRTAARGLGTQMLPQLLELAPLGGPIDSAAESLVGKNLLASGLTGAGLMAPMYAPDAQGRINNLAMGFGLGAGAHGAMELPDAFMRSIPQTTDMAALRQLAGVPDVPKGPVGDAAGASLRAKVPADPIAGLFDFANDAKIADRRAKLKARVKAQANPLDNVLAGEAPVAPASPVESTDAMKADVPGYSGLKDDKTGGTVPTPGDITPNPANDPFEKEFLKQHNVLQQLSRQNRWFLPADQIDSIARLWAQKSLELDAKPGADMMPQPSMREDASALSRVEPKQYPTIDQRSKLQDISARMNDSGQIGSPPAPRKPIPDYKALALAPDTPAPIEALNDGGAAGPPRVGLGRRMSRNAGAADLGGLLDAVKRGGKAVVRGIGNVFDPLHGVPDEIKNKVDVDYNKEKNIAVNKALEDKAHLETMRIPSDVNRAVVDSRMQKGNVNLSLLDRWPKTKEMIGKVNAAIDSESAQFGAWLKAHGYDSSAIRENLGQWLHRSYSELPLSKETLAKMTDMHKDANGVMQPGLLTRSRALQLSNGSVVPEAHGFFWRPREVKIADLTPAQAVDPYVRRQIKLQGVNIDDKAATVILEGAKDLKRRISTDEAKGFAQSILDRKDDHLVPQLGAKGVGATNITRARTAMMNDPRIRMLRGEQRGLGVFVDSLYKIRSLNARLKFFDGVWENKAKWNALFPDRKAQWVNMPDYKFLGDLAGQEVPRPIADLMIEHFGLAGRGPDNEVLGPKLNALFNWWKFKNTVMNPSSIGRQAAQNFVNLWLAGMSPVNPFNWKAHNMARQLLMGTADLSKMPLVDGVPILEQAASFLEGGSRADYQTRINKLMDAATERAMGDDPMGTWGRVMGFVDKRKLNLEHAYNFWDQQAKLATYIRARGLDGGMGVQVHDFAMPKVMDHYDAVKYVNEHFINYQRTTPIVRFVRKNPWSQMFVNPFISYKLLNVPVMARGVVRHPLRMAGLVGSLYGLSDLAWKMQGKSKADIAALRDARPGRDQFPNKWGMALPGKTPATGDMGGLFPGYEFMNLLSTMKGVGPNYDATEGIVGNTGHALTKFTLDNFLNGPLVKALGSEDREPGETDEKKWGEDLMAATMPFGSDAHGAKELYLAIKGAQSMPGQAPRSVWRATSDLLGFHTSTIDAKSIVKKYTTATSGTFDRVALQKAITPIVEKMIAGEIDGPEMQRQIKNVVAHQQDIARKVQQ